MTQILIKNLITITERRAFSLGMLVVQLEYVKFTF